MKPLNINSLCKLSNNFDDETLKKYLELHKVKIKKGEIKDLNNFVDFFRKKIPRGNHIFENYYIGYTINQISKEFDLLRFFKKNLINIELKRINTGEKITRQLVQNKYYLSFLNRIVYNFTYVASEDAIYKLNELDELEEIDIEELAKLLLEDEDEEVVDIDNLFRPANYLVSPFNSTKAFLDGKYFLTDIQHQFKKIIMTEGSNRKSNFIVIHGNAGTGKTLLTYDIAKSFMKEGLKVLIFHCGLINAGQQILISENWNIEGIKYISNYTFDNRLLRYDIVIFDEVQRIYYQQLKNVINCLSDSDVLCIFSYDAQQCLAKTEINNNIPVLIDQMVKPDKYELTNKIRTNKEIASFIMNLFDLKKPNKEYDINNVRVDFYDDENELRYHLESMKASGWTVINYTASNYNNEPFNNYKSSTYRNAHNVIGQEYDKVAVAIDHQFYYDIDGKLNYRHNTYYDATKMLFQIVTRTREQLNIVILNNSTILNRCLEILNKNKS